MFDLQTYLRRLKQEIIDHPPECALPCNLSDEWLMLLERDCRNGIPLPGQKRVGNTQDFICAPFYLVLHLLTADTNELVVSGAELEQYCRELQLEITQEIARRAGQSTSPPATLQTIFSRKDSHEKPSH
jgi:hypothetical protein